MLPLKSGAQVVFTKTLLKFYKNSAFDIVSSAGTLRHDSAELYLLLAAIGRGASYKAQIVKYNKHNKNYYIRVSALGITDCAYYDVESFRSLKKKVRKNK